jgi:ABC-type glycerol-3-phosphate transport system permease component
MSSLAATGVTRRRRPRRGRLGQAIRYGLIAVLLLFALLPFAWMVITAIKPMAEAYTTPIRWWPSVPTLDNFVAVLTKTDFPRNLLNTVIVAGVTAVISTSIAVFAAYGLSRLGTRRTQNLVLVLLFAQMIPTVLLVLPYFIIFRTLGLLDTLTALVVTNVSFTAPIATWILRRFIAKVPRELDDAAMIDGCSRLGALLRVVVPAARAGIAAVFFYTFLVAWHEYLFALSLTSSPQNRVATLAIASLVGEYSVSWGQLMSLGIVVAAPLLVLFLMVEKSLIEGLAGGVKG